MFTCLQYNVHFHNTDSINTAAVMAGVHFDFFPESYQTAVTETQHLFQNLHMKSLCLPLVRKPSHVETHQEEWSFADSSLIRKKGNLN